MRVDVTGLDLLLIVVVVAAGLWLQRDLGREINRREWHHLGRAERHSRPRR
jgi:hypothetical protein